MELSLTKGVWVGGEVWGRVAKRRDGWLGGDGWLSWYPSAPACYRSTLSSNSDIPQVRSVHPKIRCKGVANTF